MLKRTSRSMKTVPSSLKSQAQRPLKEDQSIRVCGGHWGAWPPLLLYAAHAHLHGAFVMHEQRQHCRPNSFQTQLKTFFKTKLKPHDSSWRCWCWCMTLGETAAQAPPRQHSTVMSRHELCGWCVAGTCTSRACLLGDGRAQGQRGRRRDVTRPCSDSPTVP